MMWLYLSLLIAVTVGVVLGLASGRWDEEDPPEPGSLESEIR